MELKSSTVLCALFVLAGVMSGEARWQGASPIADLAREYGCPRGAERLVRRKRKDARSFRRRTGGTVCTRAGRIPSTCVPARTTPYQPDHYGMSWIRTQDRDTDAGRVSASTTPAAKRQAVPRVMASSRWRQTPRRRLYGYPATGPYYMGRYHTDEESALSRKLTLGQSEFEFEKLRLAFSKIYTNNSNQIVGDRSSSQ